MNAVPQSVPEDINVPNARRDAPSLAAKFDQPGSSRNPVGAAMGNGTRDKPQGWSRRKVADITSRMIKACAVRSRFPGFLFANCSLAYNSTHDGKIAVEAKFRNKDETRKYLALGKVFPQVLSPTSDTHFGTAASLKVSSTDGS